MHPEFIKWLKQQKYSFYYHVPNYNTMGGWCIKSNNLIGICSSNTWDWDDIMGGLNNE